MTQLNVDELSKRGIETIIIASVDMQGRLCGRRLPFSSFKEKPSRNYSISTCALGWDYSQDVGMNARFTGSHTGWHDVVLRPDLSSVYPLAWLNNTALVFADLVDPTHDEQIILAPRNILRRQERRFWDAGLKIKLATEVEFYLYSCTYADAATAAYVSLPPTTPRRSQDLIDRTTNAVEPFFSELRRALGDSGINVLCSEAEWGCGQWEVNIAHTEATRSADIHLLLKLAVKDIAARYGLAATFMAKPRFDDVGSSCHVNASVWSDGGRNLFYEGAVVPPYGQQLLHAVGGLLERIPDLMVWYAPTVNSYKRTNSRQYAGCGMTWGFDNRTVTCRVIGSCEDDFRVEFRLPGADANPCLVSAGVLAAMLDGIELKLDPGPPTRGNAYNGAGADGVPRSLEQAANVFERSSFVQRVFGVDIAEHYATLARYESHQSQQAVTDWELRRYFESA